MTSDIGWGPRQLPTASDNPSRTHRGPPGTAADIARVLGAQQAALDSWNNGGQHWTQELCGTAASNRIVLSFPDSRARHWTRVSIAHRDSQLSYPNTQNSCIQTLWNIVSEHSGLLYQQQEHLPPFTRRSTPAPAPELFRRRLVGRPRRLDA